MSNRIPKSERRKLILYLAVNAATDRTFWAAIDDAREKRFAHVLIGEELLVGMTAIHPKCPKTLWVALTPMGFQLAKQLWPTSELPNTWEGFAPCIK